MRIDRLLLSLLLVLGVGLAAASAQDGEFTHASSPPTIDGLGDDAVWQTANSWGTDSFFLAGAGEELDGEDDLDITLKGLWDSDNLYVYVQVTDDEVIVDEPCDWKSDSVELYIDAQNLDVEDYRPDQNPETPAYQFTALAGNSLEDEDALCSWRIEEDAEDAEDVEGEYQSVFTHGINSYDGADFDTTYPKGADTSVSVLSGNTYTLEAAFPWEALESTAEEIQANDGFGFGVAINDTDFDPNMRDTQMMWQTPAADLWMRSDTFPTVELVGSAAPPGDFNGDGNLDAADLDLLSQGQKDNDPEFDLTGDGMTNVDDRLEWINNIKGTWAGDSNLDGEFNSGDFVVAFTAGKYETGDMAGWAEGDWDGNMLFDSGDFVFAFAEGGYEQGPRAATAAVPEPSSVALLLLGGFAFIRRRR